MRKVLSALLALTMVLSLVPAFAVSTQALQSVKWQYEVSDGGATITGFDKSVSGAVVIPSQLGGYPVTAIGRYAFEGCSGLTSVTIPSSVKLIDNSAFEYCGGLTNLTLSEGVISIGRDAFASCSRLTDIYIPSSVTEIKEGAFSGCIGLTNITVSGNNPVYKSSGNCLINKSMKMLALGCKASVIPSDGSVTSIGSSAFEDCTGLTNIIIPSRVTSIGSSAFSGCVGLKNINIPSSVTDIGLYTFKRCTGLTAIIIPKSVTSIGEGAFSGCTGLKSINIPSNVTEIGQVMFEGCTSLTSINIPSSVTFIGNSAFLDCTSLTSIYIPSSVTAMSGSAFNGCTNLTRIIVNKDNSVFKSVGNCLIDKKTKTLIAGCKTSVIPTDGSVTSIGNWAFTRCTGLTNINIPSSVTSIGYRSFNRCTGLKSINIPASVTGVGWYAFMGCTGLTSVTISQGVTSIGDFAFSDCKNLIKLYIPASITNIGTHSFDGCSGLTSITVNSNNSVYKSAGNCLIDKSEKTLIRGCNTSVIPTDGSITTIDYSAFSDCARLKSINIPASVTEIRGVAFLGCTELTTLTVNSGNPVYKSAGNCLIKKSTKTLISGCKTSVIPTDGSVTKIDMFAFKDCTRLKSISIPASVNYISQWAFLNCTGLTSISVNKNNPIYSSSGNCLIEKSTKKLILGCKTSVIPSNGSVTSIDRYAFDDCTGLTNITIPSSVTVIDNGAFTGCTGLASINVDQNNPVYKCAGNCLINKSTKNLVAGCKTSVIPTDGSVSSIGYSAFEGCAGLTSINIPSSITSIGDSAFCDCSGLTSINIPENVTSIGEDAFYGCDNLTIYGKAGSYAQKYAGENGIPFVASAIPDFVCGDANGDGTVDISDAMLVFYHVAGKNLLPSSVLVHCDTDDSGAVDIVDAMKIFYYVANKTDSVK